MFPNMKRPKGRGEMREIGSSFMFVVASWRPAAPFPLCELLLHKPAQADARWRRLDYHTLKILGLITCIMGFGRPEFGVPSPLYHSHSFRGGSTGGGGAGGASAPPQYKHWGGIAPPMEGIKFLVPPIVRKVIKDHLVHNIQYWYIAS